MSYIIPKPKVDNGLPTPQSFSRNDCIFPIFLIRKYYGQFYKLMTHNTVVIGLAKSDY